MKTICTVLGVCAMVLGPLASAQGMRTDLTGSSIPATTAQRTIVIGPDTRWINVMQGEEIRFVAGTSEFGWRFNGPGAGSFDLQQVAPSGALSRPVTAYIANGAGHPGR